MKRERNKARRLVHTKLWNSLREYSMSWTSISSSISCVASTVQQIRILEGVGRVEWNQTGNLIGELAEIMYIFVVNNENI